MKLRSVPAAWKSGIVARADRLWLGRHRPRDRVHVAHKAVIRDSVVAAQRAHTHACTECVCISQCQGQELQT